MHLKGSASIQLLISMSRFCPMNLRSHSATVCRRGQGLRERHLSGFGEDGEML